MRKIKSISKGYGQDSEFYTTDERFKKEPDWYHEIKEEVATIGKGYYNDLTLTVFRCYRHSKEKCLVEIESNSALTITYYPS